MVQGLCMMILDVYIYIRVFHVHIIYITYIMFFLIDTK